MKKLLLWVIVITVLLCAVGFLVYIVISWPGEDQGRRWARKYAEKAKLCKTAGDVELRQTYRALGTWFVDVGCKGGKVLYTLECRRPGKCSINKWVWLGDEPPPRRK